MSGKNFQAKVHFVAGKGGVGKTVIAGALAHHFAKQYKTLLIELSEEETGDTRPKLATIKEHHSKKFSHIKFFPDQTLYEYLTLKIPQRMVLDSFMSQTLFRALGSAMPGLADLTRLGKIWFHADAEHEPKGEIYQKIVVDMPSSGFVSRFLTIARVVSDAVRIGPLAKEAKLISEYFGNANNARLHIVAMLQELVVNETIELLHDIKEAKSTHVGLLLVNRIFPEPGLTRATSERAIGSELQKVINFFSARADAEAHEMARLKKSAVNIPMLCIPDFIGEEHEDDIIKYMVSLLMLGDKS